MGLPFSFASHFAPDMLWQALSLYREHFTPSRTLAQPYAMVCINVITADSERDACFLFTSMQQQFINLHRGRPGPLPPPVMSDIEALVKDTGADKLMINGQIFDHQARLRSFEIAMSRRGQVTPAPVRPSSLRGSILSLDHTTTGGGVRSHVSTTPWLARHGRRLLSPGAERHPRATFRLLIQGITHRHRSGGGGGGGRSARRRHRGAARADRHG